MDINDRFMQHCVLFHVSAKIYVFNTVDTICYGISILTFQWKIKRNTGMCSTFATLLIYGWINESFVGFLDWSQGIWIYAICIADYSFRFMASSDRLVLFKFWSLFCNMNSFIFATESLYHKKFTWKMF